MVGVLKKKKKNSYAETECLDLRVPSACARGENNLFQILTRTLFFTFLFSLFSF